MNEFIHAVVVLSALTAFPVFADQAKVASSFCILEGGIAEGMDFPIHNYACTARCTDQADNFEVSRMFWPLNEFFASGRIGMKNKVFKRAEQKLIGKGYAKGVLLSSGRYDDSFISLYFKNQDSRTHSAVADDYCTVNYGRANYSLNCPNQSMASFGEVGIRFIDKIMLMSKEAPYDRVGQIEYALKYFPDEKRIIYLYERRR